LARKQVALERLRQQLLEFLHARQFVDVLEPEAQQKFLAGSVENGASDYGLSARGRDQLAIEQGGDDAAGIDAADLADLGHRDRLFVRDDGQSFERRK